MGVQVTLALSNNKYENNNNPSAGIGRQGKLKFYWLKFINVQVVFRITYFILINKAYYITIFN